MKSILTVFIILYSVQFSFGQDCFSTTHMNMNRVSSNAWYVPERHRAFRERRNTLYLELGGSGGFGSFNYEWNFHASFLRRWMLRTGISGAYIDKNNGAAIILPVMAHYVYGDIHKLDLGIGQAFTVTTRGNFFARMPVSIGYRLEPKESRIFYRFSYTPIVSYLVDFQWEHWAGISVGYTLNPYIKR